MTPDDAVALLLDVDNTLLDNDRIQEAVFAAFPAADLTVERIGDLSAFDLPHLLASQPHDLPTPTDQPAGRKDAP